MDGFDPALLVGLAIWCVAVPAASPASLLLAAEFQRVANTPW